MYACIVRVSMYVCMYLSIYLSMYICIPFVIATTTSLTVYSSNCVLGVKPLEASILFTLWIEAVGMSVDNLVKLSL